MSTLKTQALFPTLSAELLRQLRDRGLETPLPSLLNAPETILQFGWGKFLRGFTPDFVQLANQANHYRGRILAVQRASDQRQQAGVRQNTLYTLILRGQQDHRPVEIKRIIGAVSRVLAAEGQWAQVNAAVRKRDLRVIVTNATEAGLTFDPADRRDLSPPGSFPGKLTQLLFERWEATSGQDADIAVIPTELVSDNGSLLKSLLLEQTRAWSLGNAFEEWLRSSVHVASTLVDRIVVGTPHADMLAQECSALGYRDDLLTCGEPYYLFAIQADEFTKRNFPIHIATPNVRYVDDLAPYRRRKLRLLNGPQMVLSTLGTLLDFALVRDVVRDQQIGAFTQQTIWQEIIPAMGAEEETLNSEYARECYQRIGNPTIEHRLEGIRMYLTTKNAIRLFPSVRDFMNQRNDSPSRLLLTIAATLAATLQIQLQDMHADYIATRWAAAAPHSPESTGAFARDVLMRLCESVHEDLEVVSVAPEVANLLLQIRKDGLRDVLARRFPVGQVSS